MQFYAIADRGPNADVPQYDNGEKVTDAKIGIYTIDGKTAIDLKNEINAIETAIENHLCLDI